MPALRFLIFLAVLATANSALAEFAVSLFVPDQKAASREYSEALQGALRRVAPALPVKIIGTLDELPEQTRGVVVAVGSQAFQSVIQKPRRVPVLAALMPRFAYERAAQQAPGVQAVSAVFLDQPEERQLALLSLLPGPPVTVGVMRTANQVLSLSRLRSGAAKFRLKLREEVLSPEYELATAIQNLAGQADVILASPDPAIFSPQTIPGILLSAYRARVPLVGFSPAYTRAGALVSLHSSVRQLAEQAAEMIRAMAAGASLPAPQVPNDFEVSINRQVARSMGLDLPSEAAMVERLKALERAP